MSDGDTALHVTMPEKDHRRRRGPADKISDGPAASCGQCGQRHGMTAEANCPAFGKQCHKCQRFRHLSAKCRRAVKSRSVRAVDEDGDVE